MGRRWILYIIQCRDGSLYTGITTDLEKRLKRHNEGRASKYTRVKRPVKLIYKEIYHTESSARIREIEIKKLSRQSKLKLIKYGSRHAIIPLGRFDLLRPRDEIFKQQQYKISSLGCFYSSQPRDKISLRSILGDVVQSV